jgi:hypothetical protein
VDEMLYQPEAAGDFHLGAHGNDDGSIPMESRRACATSTQAERRYHHDRGTSAKDRDKRHRHGVPPASGALPPVLVAGSDPVPSHAPYEEGASRLRHDGWPRVEGWTFGARMAGADQSDHSVLRECGPDAQWAGREQGQCTGEQVRETYRES